MVVLLAEPQVYQWTRSEYYKIAELGLFSGKPVELIEGQIIAMSPMGTRPRTSMRLTEKALRGIFHQGYFASTQCPLDLSEISEPEPDVTVIVGDVRDYTDTHPTTAVLVVEIAETSLAYDRTTKASLYATAGILEYWIVNLSGRQLEVHHHPTEDVAQSYGFGYAEVTIHTVGDSVRPLAAPQTAIAVADLLP